MNLILTFVMFCKCFSLWYRKLTCIIIHRMYMYNVGTLQLLHILPYCVANDLFFLNPCEGQPRAYPKVTYAIIAQFLNAL